MRIVVLMILLESIAAQEFHLEMEATWAEAGYVCGRHDYSLLPGRSYRKSDLVKTLTDGQTVWVRGWRMVTDQQPDAKGRVPFLKVEFIPNYTFATRYYICKDGKDDGGGIHVSSESPITQPDADVWCQQKGQSLAAIETAMDITRVIDAIRYGASHWTGPVSSRGRFAKQCLTARRRGTRIAYAYSDCTVQHGFICLEDAVASSRLAPIVVRKSMAFVEIEAEIGRVASMPIATSTSRMNIVPTETSASSLSAPEHKSNTSTSYLQHTRVTSSHDTLNSIPDNSASANTFSHTVNSAMLRGSSVQVNVDSSVVSTSRDTPTSVHEPIIVITTELSETYTAIQATLSSNVDYAQTSTAIPSYHISSSDILSISSASIGASVTPSVTSVSNRQTSPVSSSEYSYSGVNVHSHSSSNQASTGIFKGFTYTSSAVQVETETDSTTDLPARSQATIVITPTISSVVRQHTVHSVTPLFPLPSEADVLYDDIYSSTSPADMSVTPTPPLLMNSSMMIFESSDTRTVSPVTSSSATSSAGESEPNRDTSRFTILSTNVSNMDSVLYTGSHITSSRYSKTTLPSSVSTQRFETLTTSTIVKRINATIQSMLPTSTVAYRPIYPFTRWVAIPPTTAEPDGAFKHRKQGRDTAGGLVWIAIVSIAVAVTTAVVIAFVLHRRRQHQTKLPMNGSGPALTDRALNNNGNKTPIPHDDLSPTSGEYQTTEASHDPESCL